MTKQSAEKDLDSILQQRADVLAQPQAEIVVDVTKTILVFYVGNK